MAIEYTKVDRDIIENVKFWINDDTPIINGQTPRYLGQPIPLQFPPKITSDGKKSNWKEEPGVFYEPIAIYKGATPRTLNLEFQYIMDGNEWTGRKIAEITSMIKAYFYRNMEDGNQKEEEGGGVAAPVVTIQSMYGAVREGGNVSPAKGSTWRMLDANVDWSDIVVMEEGLPWNQSAVVKMNLASFSQINDETKGKKGAQPATNVTRSVYVEWF